MIKVSPLFSGSKGNCTLIQTDNSNILLDAGYGYKHIKEKLLQFGLPIKDVSAVVVTHEHSDHISALPQLARERGIKIYAPKQICGYVCEKTVRSDVIAVDGPFELNGAFVEVYKCSHDARECLGYRFSDGKTSFACVTDTGVTNAELVNFLSPCSAVMLESNHDVDMLNNGRYPFLLKQRILSDCGHLSNVQAADTLCGIVKNGVKNIILAHLSEENNTKELAFNTTVNALGKFGAVEGRDVNVYVAGQQFNTRTIIC